MEETMGSVELEFELEDDGLESFLDDDEPPPPPPKRNGRRMEEAMGNHSDAKGGCIGGWDGVAGATTVAFVLDEA